MKKFFATAAMAMSMGCVFAQGNINTNDSTANDSTKAKIEALLWAIANDSVANDSTKALAIANDSVANDSTKALAIANDSVANDSTKALMAQNDTVVTDSTKAQPATLVAYHAVNDTVTAEKKDLEKKTPATCDKKAGEKAIEAFNAMRKINA